MGYIGRRIGKSQTTANPQADGNSGGILDIFSNGYFQRTGNIPNFPGFTIQISASTSSVNEGSSVTFTITTTGIASGTTLFWSTNQVSGTIDASDFSDSATTGSFTITNGTGTVTRTLSNDIKTEGTESFSLSIRENSVSGNILITSGTITINDTSVPISATGGTKLTPGNGFVYHLFTSSPNPGLVISSGTGDASVLVVASGGDGGVCGGGGGGAGGVVVHPALPVSPGTYPVIVGASPGISPTGSPCGYRNNGNDSSFNNPSGPWSLVAKGGGAGGGADSQVGLSGGSSGGNSYPNGTVGSATQPGQTQPGVPPGWQNFGNAGGQGTDGSPGKGGGGSSTRGGPEGGIPRGSGGRAAAFPSFPGPLFTPMPAPWQSAVGPTGKFAGGGGASAPDSTAEGGGSPGSGGSCIDNTGGGGGGGGDANRGASGIVIVRYPVGN